MSDRPALLIDVDGVLAPFGADAPEGFRRVDMNHVMPGLWIHVADHMGVRLLRLRQHFEFVWATMWEEQANEHLLDLHGMEDPLEVIAFNHHAENNIEGYPEIEGVEFKMSGYRLDPTVETLKFPFVRAWAEWTKRPFAWIDDDLGKDVMTWAQLRTKEGIPTLAMLIDYKTGLTDEHAEQLIAWADGVDDLEARTA